MWSAQKATVPLSRRLRSAAILSLVFLNPPLAAIGADTPSTRKTVNLYWTDTGVYAGKGNRPAALDRPDEFMFKAFPDDVKPCPLGVPRSGQILIPMPSNEDLPDTEAGRSELRAQLYMGIKARVEGALQEGVHSFEIRTVQNISLFGGYSTAPIPEVPTGQQRHCVEFTSAFLEALARVKEDLAADCKVSAVGLVGSNGGYTSTQSIAKAKRSLLDHLIIVDGRAYVGKALEAASAMNGSLTLVNTGGDAPSLPDMVASHEGAKWVQRRDQRVRVVYVDPEGTNWPGSAHIATLLKPDVRLDVKYHTAADGYSPKTTMRASDLIASLVASPRPSTSARAPTQLDGVSMEMEVRDSSFEKDSSGRLDEARREATENRPDEDSLSWPARGGKDSK